MPTAAELLEGEVLDGGWEVVEELEPPPQATGGRFSVGYLVESEDGRNGYLKALDFSEAFQAADPARQIELVTERFNFERDVLEKCRARGMTRVVLALAEGKTEIPNATKGPKIVQYLIFELADGDVRTNLDDGDRYELTWIFRALHDIAVGLNQLHTAGIAHQDLKPSNVLVFQDEEARKLADFGRAAYRDHDPPHQDLTVAGDRSYAPPELLYGHVDPEWDRRRFGCDAYLLGSMAVFFFTGQGMTALLNAELAPEHRWRPWNGPYEEVLPYVREAFNSVMSMVESRMTEKLATDLMPSIRYLCDPDPDRRGHPRNHGRGANQYGLQRFVTRFDLLANRAYAGYYG